MPETHRTNEVSPGRRFRKRFVGATRTGELAAHGPAFTSSICSSSNASRATVRPSPSVNLHLVYAAWLVDDHDRADSAGIEPSPPELRSSVVPLRIHPSRPPLGSTSREPSSTVSRTQRRRKKMGYRCPPATTHPRLMRRKFQLDPCSDHSRNRTGKSMPCRLESRRRTHNIPRAFRKKAHRGSKNTRLALRSFRACRDTPRASLGTVNIGYRLLRMHPRPCCSDCSSNKQARGGQD